MLPSKSFCSALIMLAFICGCRTPAPDSDLNADVINTHIYEVGKITPDAVKTTLTAPDQLKTKEAFARHLDEFNQRLMQTGYQEELTSSSCSVGRQLAQYFSTTGPYEIKGAEDLQKAYEDESKQARLVPTRKIVISEVAFEQTKANGIRMSVKTVMYIMGNEDFGSPQGGGQSYGEAVKLSPDLSAAEKTLSPQASKEVFWSYFCSGFNKTVAQYGWVAKKDGATLPVSQLPVIY